MPPLSGLVDKNSSTLKMGQQVPLNRLHLSTKPRGITSHMTSDPNEEQSPISITRLGLI
jgi:hypothetical protein